MWKMSSQPGAPGRGRMVPHWMGWLSRLPGLLSGPGAHSLWAELAPERMEATAVGNCDSWFEQAESMHDSTRSPRKAGSSAWPSSCPLGMWPCLCTHQVRVWRRNARAWRVHVCKPAWHSRACRVPCHSVISAPLFLLGSWDLISSSFPEHHVSVRRSWSYLGDLEYIMWARSSRNIKLWLSCYCILAPRSINTAVERFSKAEYLMLLKLKSFSSLLFLHCFLCISYAELPHIGKKKS